MPKYKYTKRADGRYSTRVTLGRNYETGKPIIKTIYANTSKELDVKRQEIFDLEDVKHKEIQFHDYSQKWLETKKIHISIGTYKMYEYILRTQTKKIRYMCVKDIIKMDIQDLINNIANIPNTAKKTHMTLKQIFECAIDDDIIIKNPCRNIVLPKYKANEKRVLTTEEDYLSDIANFSDRERAYIYLIKYCGLRKEEALALNIDDFDINNNTVTINKALIFINNKPLIKEPKSQAGYRTIPLVKKCAMFIKYYLSTLSHDYLFYSLRTHEQITEQSFKKMWQSIIKKINIAGSRLANKYTSTGLTSHIFRHTYASLLLEAGVPIKQAQYWMGHSDTKTLMDVYVHIDKKNMDKVENIEKYIKTTDKKIKEKLSLS